MLDQKSFCCWRDVAISSGDKVGGEDEGLVSLCAAPAPPARASSSHLAKRVLGEIFCCVCQCCRSWAAAWRRRSWSSTCRRLQSKRHSDQAASSIDLLECFLSSTSGAMAASHELPPPACPQRGREHPVGSGTCLTARNRTSLFRIWRTHSARCRSRALDCNGSHMTLDCSNLADSADHHRCCWNSGGCGWGVASGAV